MVNSAVTHALKKHMPCFFPLKAHLSLLAGKPDSTSALHLGAILNSEITDKKDKKCKNGNIMHTVKKRTLACSMRAETQRAEHLLVQPQSRACINFHCSVHIEQ